MKFEANFKCSSTQDAIHALQEIINQLEDGHSCSHLCGVDGSWYCSKEGDDCRLVSVEWDVSDSGFETFMNVGIPRQVWVPMSVEEDDIADWLSDEYGYCVESFTIEDEE